MERRDIESFYPLSPTQQGMLFHSLAAPDSGMYVGQVGFRLEGHLDVGALRRAWGEVTARHGALRTSFRWRDLKEPIQVVSRRSRCDFFDLDWRRLDERGKERCRSELLRGDLRRGFDLTQAPLVRMTLLRLSDGVAELLWTRHHLVVDGWSVSLLFQELLRRYQALVAGKPLPLGPAPRYRDYIAWLRRQDPDNEAATWQRELAGLSEPAVFEYGTAESAGAGGDEQWADAAGEVPWSTTAGLSSLGRSQGVTLATLVQGAWAILLARYLNRDEALFGTVVAGRPAEIEDVQAMVGLFINTQPLRAHVPAERGFLDWVRDLQGHLSELRHGEYLALHQIQGWSPLPRGHAMFETLLVYENYPVDPLLLGPSREVSREQTTYELGSQGLAAADLRILRGHARERTNYPLTLVFRQGQTLPISAIYDRSRMSAADVDRLLRHFVRLLEGITEDPRRPLGELPWMSAAERHELLVEWDGPRVAPAASTVDELVRRQAERSPDAVALVQADQRLTYAQLVQRSEAFAAALSAAGVGPGDRVGIGLDRTPALLVAVLGVLHAGAAYVPLDPSYPDARLALMVEDATLAALVAEPGSELEALAPAGCPVLAPRPLVEEGEPRSMPARSRSEAPAYVIYTSGST
ncbi:MAG: AMP-binding protein, partial [Acidobacteria bacterium]|nr:AMP-binding protein [Acidobacteriota bacterium]